MLRRALLQIVMAACLTVQSYLAIHFAQAGEPVWALICVALAIWEGAELACMIGRDGVLGWRR